MSEKSKPVIDMSKLEEKVAPPTNIPKFTPPPIRNENSVVAGYGRFSSAANQPVKIDVKAADNPGEVQTIKWTNRRRMAWLAMVSMIVIMLLMMFVVPIERLGPLGNLAEMFFITMTGVVAAYMGFTALPLMGKGSSAKFKQSDY